MNMHDNTLMFVQTTKQGMCENSQLLPFLYACSIDVTYNVVIFIHKYIKGPSCF